MNGRDLPDRIVVDQNGNYWRDFGDGYSMVPVSTDNEPVVVTATYRLVQPSTLAVDCTEDEYDALARQLHESIAEGQSVALTAKALRILAAPPLSDILGAAKQVDALWDEPDIGAELDDTIWMSDEVDLANALRALRRVLRP